MPALLGICQRSAGFHCGLVFLSLCSYTRFQVPIIPSGMRLIILHLADAGLFIFHLALVLFNLTGWIWRHTRPWHLATLAATMASWLALGIWFGFGYCVCTDLQWRVRRALGEQILDQSYVQYLVARLSGWRPPLELATQCTGAVFAIVAVLSLALNARDFRDRRRLLSVA